MGNHITRSDIENARKNYLKNGGNVTVLPPEKNPKVRIKVGVVDKMSWGSAIREANTARMLTMRKEML